MQGKGFALHLGEDSHNVMRNKKIILYIMEVQYMY